MEGMAESPVHLDVGPYRLPRKALPPGALALDACHQVRRGTVLHGSRVWADCALP